MNMPPDIDTFDLDIFGLDIEDPSHAQYFRRLYESDLRTWQAILDDAEVEIEIAAYDLRDYRRRFHLPIRAAGDFETYRYFRRRAWRDYVSIRIGLETIRERVNRIKTALNALNSRYPEE